MGKAGTMLVLVMMVCLWGELRVYGTPADHTPSPIVYIPGKSGNQMNAKIDRTFVRFELCPKKSDGWFRIWLNVWDFLYSRFRIQCWSDNMHLNYNSTTSTTYNNPGVEIEAHGFGDTYTIENVDDSYMAQFLRWVVGNLGDYFNYFIEEVRKLGLERGTTIRGAPYDFRLAPHSQGDYFRRLKVLIEETYHNGGNRRVTLMGHSNGGQMGLYFLKEQSAAWKQRYIHAFIPVNTPWGGAAMATHMYASGHNWGIWMLSPDLIREQQRSFETGVYLLPRPEVWGASINLIQTPTKNYTTANYRQFFHDIGYDVGYEMLQNTYSDKYSLSHPGVPTYCIYSSGILTVDKLVYREGDFPEGQPTHHLADGDGTVSTKSLEYCRTFLTSDPSIDPNMTHIHQFSRVDHINLINDAGFMTIVKRVLLS